MNLAAASGEDLATTSDIVTDALTAFGLSAKDSGHFADILAAASSNANTNVSMMGETFKYCAPIAGALGFSAEDTAEAIGLMANAGIKSSQAGTALRTIMNNLTGEVKLSGSALGEVQIATTNADGSMRDLSDILADCRSAFGQMTESEKAQAAETLVGKNAMSGFLALMNAAPADIDKLSTAINNCNGTSEKMAATMQDNLTGQLTILKSQLEELAISFGELLMPAIRQIVSWVQSFVDKLNSMDETIITIALMAAAIGPVLIVIGKVISAVGTIMTVVPKVAGVINTVKTAFAALNTTMLANPIVLIIAAITALVAAFIYLWNTNEDFRQFWIDLWENIKEVAIAVWETIKAFFAAAWEAISSTAQTIWNGIKDFFSGLWESIKTVFSTVLEVINTIITTYFNVYKTIITTVFNAIKTIVTTVWNAVKTVITTVVAAIQTFISTTFNAIKTVIVTVVNAIKTTITTVFTAIKTVITTIITAVQTFITTAWNNIKTVVTIVVNAIKAVISTVFNAIKSVITSVMNGVSSTISTIWNNIKSTVSTVLNGIKSAVSTVFNNILSAIKTAMSNVLSAVKTGFSNVKSHITGLASQAFNWGKDLIMGIVKGIKSCIGAVGDAVSSVANKIKSFLHFSVPDEGPLTDYESWMPDFMEGLAKGIEKSRGVIQKAVEDVSSDLLVNPQLNSNQAVVTDGGATQSDMTGLIGAIRDAVSGANGNSGDIVIPVYLGGTMLDEVIINAQQRANLRSGGR
jgi:TP901 family phage tail tape measure protein